MSYAVILVAWLAMMPQLMPKQRTDFFDWAMSTLLPAQRRARPMDSGKNKCWVTGHALGEHSPTGRLSNSDRPSA